VPRAKSQEPKGSEGEWKDPDAVSCAMRHQGVLTTNRAAERHLILDFDFRYIVAYPKAVNQANEVPGNIISIGCLSDCRGTRSLWRKLE
jgi:hypothetical protein